MTPLIKICGLKTPEALAASAEAGATHAGFNFFPKSPRYLRLDAARHLATGMPLSLTAVALLVDPSDDELRAAVEAIAADAVQLHGQETPERVAAVKALTGLDVIKALPVSSRADIAAARAYKAADRFLFDARPPAGADRPGGNGAAFDWTLLAGADISRPWILSGGLTPENVVQAIEATGAPGVDVSSGVESAPGVKDFGKLSAFIGAASSAYGLLESTT